MPQYWTDIRQWFAEEDRVIALNLDSITLYTGDEGAGKSLTMLAVNYIKTGGRFNIDRVHFEQEDFMADCIALEPGSAVQLDEFDGHRRMAMHGKRLKFLKFLKERRALRLRMSIGFPHVDQMERDILTSRIRYWVDIPERGLIVIHRRRSKTINRPGEPPKKVVDFPEAGRFRIDEPTGPLIKLYDAKKAAFTHRDDDIIQDLAPVRRMDVEAARPVLEEIRAALPAAASTLPPNMAFVDQVLADLKRSP